MPKFEGFKNISQGIFYWIVIAVIILIGAWLVTSIVGNIILNNQNKPIGEPDINKAHYAVLIHATNEVLFTDKYDTGYHVDLSGSQDKSLHVYTLHGFFELKGKKYIWHKKDNSLDEYYFGKIEVLKRQEVNK